MENEFEISMNKNENLYSWIYRTLTEYFEYLTKDIFKDKLKGYDVTLVKTNTYLRYERDDRIDKVYSEPIKNIMHDKAKRILECEKSIHTMDNLVHWYEEDGLMKIKSFEIFIDEDGVNKFILLHIDNMSDAMKLLKLIMLHEIGHIIDNTDRNGISRDEYDRAKQENISLHNDHNERTIGCVDTRESWLEYFSIPYEKHANEKVGINTYELCDLYFKLRHENKEYQTNLKIKSNTRYE